MNSAKNTPVTGIDRNTYRKLELQYKRENPHNLPELRRKRRPRIFVKPKSVLVFSMSYRA